MINKTFSWSSCITKIYLEIFRFFKYAYINITINNGNEKELVKQKPIQIANLLYHIFIILNKSK